MLHIIPRWLVVVGTGLGLSLIAGCGGGGGSSVPTPTPTPTATPGPVQFDLDALFTGATDPVVPSVFTTMEGRGSISNSPLPASFSAVFYRDDVDNRVLRFAATSAARLRNGSTFYVNGGKTASVTYSDIPNKRYFVAQSGTIRLVRIGVGTTPIGRTVRFTLTDLRMVPDTTVASNSAVGSFTLSASGLFSSQGGALTAFR